MKIPSILKLKADLRQEILATTRCRIFAFKFTIRKYKYKNTVSSTYPDAGYPDRRLSG